MLNFNQVLSAVESEARKKSYIRINKYEKITSLDPAAILSGWHRLQRPDNPQTPAKWWQGYTVAKGLKVSILHLPEKFFSFLHFTALHLLATVSPDVKVGRSSCEGCIRRSGKQ